MSFDLDLDLGLEDPGHIWIYLQLGQLRRVLFEVREIDFGQRVDVFVAALFGDPAVVKGEKLVEEPVFEQKVLCNLIVLHGLAELIDFLQDEVPDLADCLETTAERSNVGT